MVKTTKIICYLSSHDFSKAKRSQIFLEILFGKNNHKSFADLVQPSDSLNFQQLNFRQFII